VKTAFFLHLLSDSAGAPTLVCRIALKRGLDLGFLGPPGCDKPKEVLPLRAKKKREVAAYPEIVGTAPPRGRLAP
jgi:hypothetical protein